MAQTKRNRAERREWLFEQLQQDYAHDVETLATELKPRLMAGEFNGLVDEGEGGLGMDRLENICLRHPRITDPLVGITIALSSPHIKNLWCGEIDWETYEETEFAAFCFALEVQAYAARVWDAPRDTVWGDPQPPIAPSLTALTKGHAKHATAKARAQARHKAQTH